MKNTFKQRIKFSPWCDGHHFKFVTVKAFEELGGNLPFGTIELEWDGNSEGFDMLLNLRYGTLHFSNRKVTYQFPVQIVKISMTHNHAMLDFIGIDDAIFFKDKKKNIFEGCAITDVIGMLWPNTDRMDIRIPPIIDGTRDYYQNNETDQDYLRKLCYSYSKNMIFSFGWDGLMIKDHCGRYNSRGLNEENPHNRLEVRGNSEVQVLDQFNWSIDEPGIYRKQYEAFYRDSPPEPKLYEPWVPVYFNNYIKYGTHDTVSDYKLEDWNLHHKLYLHNVALLSSELYHSIRVTSNDIPGYKLGDVLWLRRNDYHNELHHHRGDMYDWPYKFYLVASNEFFCTVDDSTYSSEDGSTMSFTSRLKCIQQYGGDTEYGNFNDPGEKDPSAD